MARLANQIVTVCAYLTNFHLALVPTPDPVDIELPSQGSPSCSDQEESENESIDITNYITVNVGLGNRLPTMRQGVGWGLEQGM